MKTILHPTDFSVANEDSFRLLCPLARDHSAEIIVLHVVSPEACDANAREGDEIDRESALYQDCWKKYSRLRDIAGDIPTSLQVKIGSPVKTIANVAQRECCDLIGFAAPYHDFIHWQYHGRISDALLRMAPCPVLCLHRSPGQSNSTPILHNMADKVLEAHP